MAQETPLRPLYGCFMALVCAGYGVTAQAGLVAPEPIIEEEFPEDCLPDDFFLNDGQQYFALNDYGGGDFGDPPGDLNADGLCSRINAGSSIIGDEITRLMMTEYFNRMNTALQNRIRSGFFGGGGDGAFAARGQSGLSGRAAGDGLADWGGWSPWISYGRTHADNDLSSTRYDANQDNVLFGVDYAYSDRFIFGISASYENNDITTSFNLGEMEVEGFSIAPYAAYMLTDSLSVDVAFGYSDLSIDQFRTEPGGDRVQGDTDASRWFVMSNLNAFHQYGNLALTGRVGLVYSEESQDGFTESGGATAETVARRRIDFGQVNVGGEVAYTAHALEPFASAYYQYDFEDGDSVRLNPNQARRSRDDDDFRLSGGFRYFDSNGFSGVIEYSRVVGRSNFDSSTLNILGRLQF